MSWAVLLKQMIGDLQLNKVDKILCRDHLLALLSCQTAASLTEPNKCPTHWPRPECPLCSKWVSGMTDCTEAEVALVFDLVP